MSLIPAAGNEAQGRGVGHSQDLGGGLEQPATGRGNGHEDRKWRERRGIDGAIFLATFSPTQITKWKQGEYMSTAMEGKIKALA